MLRSLPDALSFKQEQVGGQWQVQSSCSSCHLGPFTQDLFCQFSLTQGHGLEATEDNISL